MVVRYDRGNTQPGPPTIPWAIAEEAYAVYGSRWGTDQSLERLAERGGWTSSELDNFVPGWRERASENAKLRSDVERLQGELTELAELKARRDAAEESASRTDGGSSLSTGIHETILVLKEAQVIVEDLEGTRDAPSGLHSIEERLGIALEELQGCLEILSDPCLYSDDELDDLFGKVTNR